jgi:xylulokinase
MPLVAGVDSSTQSCKVVVCDAGTGTVLREGQAPHPGGTEVDPHDWWSALVCAVELAGGLGDVEAVSVCAQQHGLVCLDELGEVVRPSLLWNDLRSAGAANDLVSELGAGVWARSVGSVPTASFTVTKLRWLADNEPQVASRVAAACLPHDWLTWQLAGAPGLDSLCTDRGDASGTGYWSPVTNSYRLDLLKAAFGSELAVPEVLGPSEPAGRTPAGALLGPGSGDNMGAALGIGASSGDLIVSVGTSGVVCALSDAATADDWGYVAGFADATGRYLPLVCTLNAAGVLNAAATMLGVDLDELSDLALSAAPGAGGLVLVPYLEGERTPNLPDASGSIVGLRQANSTPSCIARAAVEGMLCGLAAGMDALARVGVTGHRVVLVGGGARSRAVREIAPTIFGLPVLVPEPGEYVALGAARQAAWALLGDIPQGGAALQNARVFEADLVSEVLDRYATAIETVSARS